MPIRVLYQNIDDTWCTIRPTPLVAISTQILKTSAGEAFGVNYSITLTGTLLADRGSPYGFNFAMDSGENGFGRFETISQNKPNSIGPYAAFDNNISHFDLNRPPEQFVTLNQSSQSIFSKQKALRALFAIDGQLTEITDFDDNGASIFCYPRVVSVDFQEGIYVDRCDYTITLEADTLLRNTSKIVDYEGTLIPKVSGIGFLQQLVTESELVNNYFGTFLSDFNEEWAIETDEQAENSDLPRTYRITHTINATGKTHYGDFGNNKKISAYESAKRFVLQKLKNSPTLLYDNIGYPNLKNNDARFEKNPNTPEIPFGNDIANIIGEGTIDLVTDYGGYNHLRSEQSNINAGTFSVTESWVLAKSPTFENFNISINSSVDNPYISVSIDGNIKGLSSITARGYGGLDTDREDPSSENYGKLTGYENALFKYNQITNSGQFGLTSDVYKRANNVVAVQLNSQPKTITIGSNPSTSEITYNVQFDNRPTNIMSGVLAESISVQDTYPGDMFAVIPVIGRKTGPVLQYVGGRSEYKRDLQINLTVDYSNAGYGPLRNNFLLKKPSIVEPMATQLANLINEFSPAKEPGIRKYFISPPNENWNPKEGTYSLSVSWTYEIDK